jgi:hypothetical protein
LEGKLWDVVFVGVDVGDGVRALPFPCAGTASCDPLAIAAPASSALIAAVGEGGVLVGEREGEVEVEEGVERAWGCGLSVLRRMALDFPGRMNELARPFGIGDSVC